jgi:hypothetical protein
VALWLQVGLAILVPLAALAGVWLGWWLSRRTEKRGEKRAAFVEVLSAMDNCQQACNELSAAITGKMAESLLVIPRSRAAAAINRVETAVNLAIFAVGPEHAQTLKNGTMACAEELRNANHGVDTMGIVEARIPIEKLARNETR